jgi:hypothetical protein
MSAMSKSVLLIAHTPSPNTLALATSAMNSVASQDTGDVVLRRLSPFDVSAKDVSDAAAVIIGTTENIGYMAGATKDMFDRCYNNWLGCTAAKPVAIYIRAGLDGTATKNALTSICGGLRWRLIAAPLIVQGSWQDTFCNQVSELCLSVVLGIDSGIY